MKNISAVSDNKDIVTVEYLDDVTAVADKSSNFTINDTVHYPLLALTAYGRSWQNYASHGGEPLGKNLFNHSLSEITVCGITYTPNADGTVTINGTATDDAWINIGENVLPYGQYIVSGCPSTDDQSVIGYIKLDDIHDNYDYGSGITLEGSKFRVSCFVQTGSTVNNLVYKPMIRRADITDDTYEPYYSSPNPDCPVTIESIGDSGSLTVTTCGKNLFDNDSLVNFVSEGRKIEKCDDGTLHFINTDGLYFMPTVKITLQKGVYSTIASRTTISGIAYVGINYSGNIVWLSPATPVDFTLSDTTDVEISVTSFNTRDAAEFYFNISLVKKGTNTAYEPYQSATAKITTALPLRGLPVSSGGNYTDSNGQEWICDTIEYNYTSAVKKQRTAVIDSYNGENVGNNYISTTGGLDVGATVIYPAENVIETPLTADEINQLRNLETFDGVTNIFNSENAEMSVEYLTSKAVSKAVMPIITALRGDNNA